MPFLHPPTIPVSPLLNKAYYVLTSTRETSFSFLDLFDTTRAARGARGVPTHTEQDLLRAMLTFATAGLDSLVKQLIQDGLIVVVNRDAGATKIFEEHVLQQMKRGDVNDHLKYIAGVITQTEPRNYILNQMIRDLTANSMQSRAQLLKTASYFNIPSDQITNNFGLMDQIFRARNQITHEMDIDFDQARMNRRPRRRRGMVDFTNEVFRISKMFLESVDSKL